MATRNVVPRGDLEGHLGTGEKRWGAVYAGNVNSTYVNVAAMVADTNLKVGTAAATQGYYTAGDGGHGLYTIRDKVVSDVDDGGSVIFLANGNVAELIIDGIVTPEHFGAYGDGTHDDTVAVQKSIDYSLDKNVVFYANKKYLLSDTIRITGRSRKNISAIDAEFVYSGNDYAFRIKSAQNFDIKLGKIKASNGGCVEFYSGNNSEFSQYVNLEGIVYECLTTCINFNCVGGWINEIRINRMRLQQGAYGINASGAMVQQIRLFQIGLEGVTTGIRLTDNCWYWEIIDIRSNEGCTTYIKTEGTVKKIIWMGAYLRYSECDFSSNTTEFFVFGFITTYGGMDASYMTQIVNGLPFRRPYGGTVQLGNFSEGYDMTKKIIYTVSSESYNALVRSPVGFNVWENTPFIKLAPWYGTRGGIREIYFTFGGMTSCTIYDSAGNVIFVYTGSIDDWNKRYKLTWLEAYGWAYEALNLVHPPTT